MSQEKEVQDRLRRIETKLHKICLELNVDVPADSNIRVRYVKSHVIAINIKGADVALSVIKKVLSELGHDVATMLVVVYIDNAVFCTVDFKYEAKR